MIKFFRKIRQRLVIENRFSKYIIYAIGEIFLIVIGILIAVQIGSWKSDKDNQLVFKRSLKQLNEEIGQMLWQVNPIKQDLSVISGITDSIKNKQMSADGLAENFTIITENIKFPTVISNYDQVTQNLSNQSTSYEKREISRYLNSLKNADLVELKKCQENLELITRKTVNEWSKEPWFEYRHIPDSIMNYQDEFLNHHSYRNNLDLYIKAIKEFRAEFIGAVRNIYSLKIYSDIMIKEVDIQDLPQILEKNNFLSQNLTSCKNEDPIRTEEKDGLFWTHTVIFNRSNEDVEIIEKKIDDEDVVIEKSTILSGEYFMRFFRFGSILEFKYTNGECKSAVITEPMSSIILN